MIGKKGKELGHASRCRSIDIPQFRYGNKQLGRRRPGRGRRRRRRSAPGDGEPGHGQGRRRRRASTSSRSKSRSRSWPQILGEELAAAPHRAQGQGATSSTQKDKYTGIRTTGPESLRHFKRTYKQALQAADRLGHLQPDDPDHHPDPRGQALPLLEGRCRCPQTNAVIIYMMDVSGSMADEQKEIVRIEAFWIDTWLRSQYKGIETPLHHPRRRGPRGRPHTFYHTRESGGTRISSAYKLCDEIIRRDYPPVELEHLPLPLLRRRQLGRRHASLRRAARRRSILPHVQPVRLRPGREPLRLRAVHQGPARAASASIDNVVALARSPTRTPSTGRSRTSSGRAK